jgi:hypothetical protein
MVDGVGDVLGIRRLDLGLGKSGGGSGNGSESESESGHDVVGTENVRDGKKGEGGKRKERRKMGNDHGEEGWWKWVQMRMRTRTWKGVVFGERALCV